ncbi:MAG: hypothetical protein HQK68_05945 [Desulfamplus sp.]|nr:hypothetical protein [Desulfamplus sp.]
MRSCFKSVVTATCLVVAICAICLMSLLFATQTAQAGNIYDKDGFKLDFNFEAAAIYVKSDNTYFGAGQGGTSKKDIYWTEYYMKPSLSSNYTLGNSTTIYANLAAIGQATRGDGNINSSDNGDDMAIDKAYIGWKSGKLFETEDLFDLSVGRQNFLVGRGFFMYKQGGDDPSAYWLAPNSHFNNSAIARINSKPIRADFAWVQTNEASSDTQSYGVNIEYFNEQFAALDQATLAVAYFNTAESDKSGWDGLDVYNIRANFAPLATMGMSDLYISAEYVKQENSGSHDVDADAYFAEIGYNFSKVLWTPKLFYRYAYFSGDDPATVTTDESYQYYFEGGTGWGTWYTEILGDYYGFNNNTQNQIQLEVHPSESLSAGIIYYSMDSDEGNKKIGDELNIYADYVINDWVSIGGCYAWASPDAVAKSEFGFDNAQKIELYTYLYF